MPMEFKRGPASTNYWSGGGSEPQLRYDASRKEIQFHSTIPSKGGGDTHCMLRIANDEYGETFEWIFRTMLNADSDKGFRAIAHAMMAEDFHKAIETFEQVKQETIDWQKRRDERRRARMAEIAHTA